MPLEILHLALMLLSLLQRCESAQVAAMTRSRVFLARIQTILTGFKSTNHMTGDAAPVESVA